MLASCPVTPRRPATKSRLTPHQVTPLGNANHRPYGTVRFPTTSASTPNSATLPRRIDPNGATHMVCHASPSLPPRRRTVEPAARRNMRYHDETNPTGYRRTLSFASHKPGFSARTLPRAGTSPMPNKLPGRRGLTETLFSRNQLGDQLSVALFRRQTVTPTETLSRPDPDRLSLVGSRVGQLLPLNNKHVYFQHVAETVCHPPQAPVFTLA